MTEQDDKLCEDDEHGISGDSIDRAEYHPHYHGKPPNMTGEEQYGLETMHADSILVRLSTDDGFN